MATELRNRRRRLYETVAQSKYENEALPPSGNNSIDNELNCASCIQFVTVIWRYKSAITMHPLWYVYLRNGTNLTKPVVTTFVRWLSVTLGGEHFISCKDRNSCFFDRRNTVVQFNKHCSMPQQVVAILHEHWSHVLRILGTTDIFPIEMLLSTLTFHVV